MTQTLLIAGCGYLGQELARQAEQFRELGATVKKTIDRELMEKDALLELEHPSEPQEGEERPN